MSNDLHQRAAAAKPEKATLRRQLLVSLLPPVVLVTLASVALSYYHAFNFATAAYDYSLFGSALNISRQTRFERGELSVNLPAVARRMLEYDKHDRVYYAVSNAKGQFVAGHRGLPPPPGEEDTSSGKPVYYDERYRGRMVRIAALYAQVQGEYDEEPVLIQVAETLNKRRAFVRELLLGMLLPELLLILVIGALIWYGVERGLRPLEALQKEIGSRSHRDLSPLHEHGAPAEVHSLISAMNGLLVRLNETLSAQRRFVADAAHQLRTPLAGIKTQTELALRQHEPDEVHRTLRHLGAATEQTTHLVNQLLSLARAEPGAARAQVTQPLNLDDLARESAAEWVPRAIERSIDLGFEGTPAPATIEGDALLIREMLGNLLDNAIRYTPPGGNVTLRVAAERGKVVLCVEDNGPGIPPEERERVFERFYRRLGSGADGCGLGLAIVREIAQSHNAETRLGPGAGGTGTLVTVAFPRAA